MCAGSRRAAYVASNFPVVGYLPDVEMCESGVGRSSGHGGLVAGARVIEQSVACCAPVWPKLLTSGPTYLRSSFSRGEGAVESDSREVPGLQQPPQSASFKPQPPRTNS